MGKSKDIVKVEIVKTKSVKESLMSNIIPILSLIVSAIMCYQIFIMKVQYATHKFYSFDDLRKQLRQHNRRYNDFPMRPLGWVSPKETLFNFLIDGVTYV